MVKFDIRWSDIDANRHLANSAYINFMSHARTVFLRDSGLSQKLLAQHDIGPIVFYEHVYYFQEVLPDQPIYVDVSLSGASREGKFFSFTHNFYDKTGKNKASCEMLGAWINMKTRKLTSPPAELMKKFKDLPKGKDFKILTKEDTRKYGKRPVDIPADLVY